MLNREHLVKTVEDLYGQLYRNRRNQNVQKMDGMGITNKNVIQLMLTQQQNTYQME